MDKKELLKKKDATGSMYRGQVINNCILLEKVIEVFIYTYFCGGNDKKMGQLQYLITGDSRLTLDNKIQIFVGLAKDEFTEWYNSYKSVRLQNATLANDLLYVTPHRNILAHAYMSNNMIIEPNSKSLNTIERSDESIDTVYFCKFNNVHKEMVYDKNSIDDLNNLILSTARYISTQTKIMSQIYSNKI
ncbi:hypothetical protein [Pedobacter agri]|uniref:hypothetical protein n=1 Tax=Pedobacter agri TaxID=454586 RepID=UPI00292EA60A|nr:hypothetical protein [Pedobacter agri]